MGMQITVQEGLLRQKVLESSWQVLQLHKKIQQWEISKGFGSARLLKIYLMQLELVHEKSSI